jgi:hypothetical protein
MPDITELEDQYILVGCRNNKVLSVDYVNKTLTVYWVGNPKIINVIPYLEEYEILK